MEVEPWAPTQEVTFNLLTFCQIFLVADVLDFQLPHIFCKIFLVADVLERLLERQFLLSPWVREKMLRNQLRLVLKVIFP